MGFTDTECRVDKKTSFKWNTLFQALQTKEIQVLLQDDRSREITKYIYKNIYKFGLHWEATKTPILPCLNVIEWMSQRIDHESRKFLNFENKHVLSYQAPVLNKLYHFKESHIKVTPKWL